MIILEGADGSGKTSLLKRLCADTGLPAHARASDSLTGPVKDLYGWTVADIHTWHEQPLAIYDRHPLTSEHIYGPTVRGSVRPGFEMGNEELAKMRRYMRQHALVIICCPPLDTVKANVLNENDQMLGVVENIDHIYQSYFMMLYIWPLDSHVAKFDYTVADNQRYGYNEILAAVKNHEYTWRRVSYDR